IHTDLAWIKAMLGKTEDAKVAILRAREITPGDPQVYLYSALISVRSGETSAAYADLEAAVEMGYPRKLLVAEPHLRSINKDQQFLALTSATDTDAR
ncbi:MAG: hypothetical protein ACREQ1_11260, partial [Woeseiaceae bacterium]